MKIDIEKKSPSEGMPNPTPDTGSGTSSVCVQGLKGVINGSTFNYTKSSTSQASKRKYRKSDYYHKRSPRLQQSVTPEIIRLEKPPVISEAPHLNWFTILVTPAISVGLLLVMVLAMGISPVMLIMTGTMSVISAITAVVNYRSQKKSALNRKNLTEEKYIAYLNSVKESIHTAHKAERQNLLAANPSCSECLNIVRNKDKELWNRQYTDDDFLCAALGKGNIRPAVSAVYELPKIIIDENPLEQMASTVASNSNLLEDVPVIYDFGNTPFTGLIGDHSAELQFIRNLLIQICTTHAYDELKIVVLIPEHEKDAWDWVKWLPHCMDQSRQSRYFYLSQQEADNGLNILLETLNERAEENSNMHSSNFCGHTPHYLIVASQHIWLEKHEIFECIAANKGIGCSCILVCDTLKFLPKECSSIISVDGQAGELYNLSSSEQREHFTIEVSSLEMAAQYSRTLCPVYTDVKGVDAILPSSIGFLEGYDVKSPEELDIARRWKNAVTYKSIAAPVALLASGKAYSFDIHEKYHGVNGIVAGMPGSGKTEMVQSWLLSLAVNYSPQDVAFVLIDFKGTGLLAPFEKLPHLAGAISNLDENIDRNLISIEREIARRELLLKKYSEQFNKKYEINDLNKDYSMGIVAEHLPVLIIAIDEYAEFKKCFPDFGKAIDSLTSKGRALGLFVVLMTQKPSGVVSPAAVDNINFRWCLKVANHSASREMLGTQDAAYIKNPGRAYIKIGENTAYDLVQSFWSSAPYYPGSIAKAEPFIPISLVETSGKRVPLETPKDAVKESGTQVAAVVQHICKFCQENNIASAAPVWTDKLPDTIHLKQLVPCQYHNGSWPVSASVPSPIAIGLIDDIQNQQQVPLSLDFSEIGHTAVYGAPMSGKTTLLKTLVMSAALTSAPSALNIYMIDFGGRNLEVLQKLPHVGGIVLGDQTEKINKLIMMLQSILKERQHLFSKVGVGNITAYRNTSDTSIADILLIVDNFYQVTETYPNLVDFFVALTTSGANYGIYLVATSSAPNGISFKISQNIKNNIALEMINKTDYQGLVGKLNATPESIPGRGYIKGTPPIAFQTALPTGGEDDADISQHIKKLAAEMNDAWHGERPRPIPQMPEIVSYGSIHCDLIGLGLSAQLVTPVLYSPQKQNYLLISGTPSSGKTNLLHTTARQMKEKLGGKLYVFGANPGDSAWNDADTILSDASAIDQFLEKLSPEMLRRQQAYNNGTTEVFEPWVFVFDDYDHYIGHLSPETMGRLMAIVKLGMGLELYLLLSGNAQALTAYVNQINHSLITEMAGSSQVVALGDCLGAHGAVKTSATYAVKQIPFGKWEGCLVSDGTLTRFKAMHCI